MNLKITLYLIGTFFSLSVFTQTIPTYGTKIDTLKIKQLYPNLNFKSIPYSELEDIQWQINRSENPAPPLQKYHYDENMEYYYLDEEEEMECRAYYLNYYNQSYEFQFAPEKQELPLLLHLGINFVSPLSKHTKSTMNAADFSNSNHLTSPISSGEIGLKNGFSISGSLQPPLRFINRYLNDKFSLGYIVSCDFSLLRYGWSEVSNDTTALSKLIRTADFSNLYLINIGAGIAFTYIPDIENKPFLINLYIKGGYNFIEGGEITSKHQNYKLSSYPVVNQIGFSPSFGLNIHLSRLLYFQMEYNPNLSMQNRRNSNYYVEKITQNEVSTTTQMPISNQLKLNHLKLGIGINL